MSIWLMQIAAACIFPCLDVITDFTQALPTLYHQPDTTKFWMQVVVLVLSSLVGAVTVTVDNSVWKQLGVHPGLKLAGILGFFVVFPLFPFSVLTTAAVAWIAGDADTMEECLHSVDEIVGGGIMEAVLSFALQGDAHFRDGIPGLRLSLLCSLLSISKGAFTHSTRSKVYWSLLLRGVDKKTVDKNLPIITGPLGGLMSDPGRAILLGVHYLLETTSGRGCIILFQHFARETFEVSLCRMSFAWAAFVGGQAVLLLAAAWWTALQAPMQMGTAALIGQFFIPTPLLNASLRVMPMYAVRCAGQMVVLLVSFADLGDRRELNGAEARMAELAWLVAGTSAGMMATLLALRGCAAMQVPTPWQQEALAAAWSEAADAIRSRRYNYGWGDITPRQCAHPSLTHFAKYCINDAQTPGSMYFMGAAMLNMAPEQEDATRDIELPEQPTNTFEVLAEICKHNPKWLKRVFAGLQALSISSCKALASLPAELGQLAGLQKLRISDCGALASLPAELGHLAGLQELSDILYITISRHT